MEVENYIRQLLNRRTHPEQAYKNCQGILSFSKRVGNSRLIKACKRAHEIGYYNYKTIEDILKKHLDKYEGKTCQRVCQLMKISGEATFINNF